MKIFSEFVDYVEHFFIKPFSAFRNQIFGHAVKSLRNAAGYASQSVRVAAERNAVSYRVLKTFRLQKSRNCFGDGFLATFDVSVIRANFIKRAA